MSKQPSNGRPVKPKAARKANGNGQTANGKHERPTVAQTIRSVSPKDLPEVYRFWSGEQSANGLESSKKTRDQIISWMGEPARVMSRLSELGRRLATIHDIVLAAPSYECSITQLVNAKPIAYLSSYDLDASLAVLARRGLLNERKAARPQGAERAFSIPADLGDTILRERRALRRGIFDAFTLRGHLDRMYDDPARARRTSPARVREMYKMYSNEAAAVARIDRLPEGLRDLLRKVVLEFGGLLPRGLFDRMETELPHWNGRRWGRILEESLVGTVEHLELGRYGINHNDETLITFNEVALAWLRRVAVPGDPDAPYDEASLGVDLVSNISRFLAFLIDHDVRFTIRGEIFKTTEKRILQDLIPNPGRELERSDVLAFIYRFARDVNLIESTGERTFALTPEGRAWEPQTLEQKMQALFDYTLEEQSLGGEYYHQVRMRRILVRFLKRIEPGVWYDVMYLPFLARNHYLCSLDELAVDEYFEARSNVEQHVPMEDLPRMAWNLVSWVRKRLYVLGIVDLGYDKSGRPVAMRVSRPGARLLGMLEADNEGPAIGHLVVTPDFEVVLFPTGDDAELTHDLDRFCEREKLGHLLHFHITAHSIHRALTEGMSLTRIVSMLEEHSRTPVPQNVRYSIRSWATQAGLLFLDEALTVRTSNAEVLQRFARDPGVRPYVRKIVDDNQVQLKDGTSQARMYALLRELDYLIELA